MKKKIIDICGSIKIDKSSPVPRYHQLYEQLKNLITSGKLDKGQRLSSDNEMIERLKLSRSTVRQAVDELVKDNLAYRINGLGTFVKSDTASRLSGNKYIALFRTDDVLKELKYGEWGFYSALTESLNMEMEKAGLALKKIIIDGNRDSHLSLADYKDPMLCGAIFMGNLQFKQHEIKKTLDCLETPSVFMDYHMNIPNAISVTGKDKLGGRIATEHLLKLGRKKIGFVGGQMPNYCLRFEGYLQALKKHGRDFDKSIVWFDVEKACEYISANPDAIDAVFSCGDCFTIKIMNHIYRCGLRIPEDVSLVSYDDTIVLNLLSPAVTCISVDRSEMVNKVCQAVLGKMKTSQIEVETKLIIRDSASAPI